MASQNNNQFGYLRRWGWGLFYQRKWQDKKDSDDLCRGLLPRPNKQNDTEYDSGLGESPVGTMLARQLCRPKSHPQKPWTKTRYCGTHLNPNMRKRTGMYIPGTH